MSPLQSREAERVRLERELVRLELERRERGAQSPSALVDVEARRAELARELRELEVVG